MKLSLDIKECLVGDKGIAEVKHLLLLLLLSHFSRV